MKTVSTILIVCMVAIACSTPKKTNTTRHLPAVSHEDVPKGGTSFNNPVVILRESERDVLDDEYLWLRNNYPQHALVRRSHTLRSSRHYDIVRIKTQQGQVRDIYFDCTKFWGRR